MNIEKHLILVKDEDKTEQIEYCKYLDGKWRITYYNNNKEYTYSYQNVVWHRNPRVINHETFIVKKPLNGLKFCFEDIGFNR